MLILCRLCSAIVLTTLISYISFTIALWCHVPCIEFFSYLFGSPEDQTQTRGASLEIVGSLPKYKFKTKKPIEGNGSKYDYDPSKTSGEDGIITVGTGKEKSVSAEDEVSTNLDNWKYIVRFFVVIIVDLTSHVFLSSKCRCVVFAWGNIRKMSIWESCLAHTTFMLNVLISGWKWTHLVLFANMKLEDPVKQHQNLLEIEDRVETDKF